jgi:peptide/nickel transport system substrate-binding protein
MMSFKFVRKISRLAVVTALALAAGLASNSSALAAGPERGGTLTVALRLTAASLDPLFGNALGVDRRIYNLYAENLLYQDEAGKFHPMLAESWETSPDGKTITFRLRRDVKFTDGTPFNAEAVKFNLERLLDPKTVSQTKDMLKDLQSVHVVDPYTVRVNLRQKSAVALSMLAYEPGSMMSPTAIKEKGADFARQPVGTGPFQIVSWSGNQISATRNPNYWRKAENGQALPYLDKVEIKIVANSAIRLIELQSGNAQIIDSMEAKDFDKISANPSTALLPGSTGMMQYLAFNVTAPPFNNLDLRKAVSLAINRAAVEKVIGRGAGGALGNSLEAPVTWVYDDKLRGHEFNPTLARELYKKSGHQGPMVLTVIQRDPDAQIGPLLQSMLKSAGMEVQVEMLERQAWLAKVLPRKFEMGLWQGVGRAEPDLNFANFYGANAGGNYAGFDTAPVTAGLVAQARTVTDNEARRKLYSQVQQHILDNYYNTPLFWRPIQEAASKRVQGLKREASMAFFYGDLWLTSK